MSRKYSAAEAALAKMKLRMKLHGILTEGDAPARHEVNPLTDVFQLSRTERAPAGDVAANDNASDNVLTQALQAYVAGLPMNEGLDAENEFIAPEVQTPGIRFDYLDRSGGLSIESDDGDGDVRASGADFKTLKEGGVHTTTRLFNRGLASEIDEEDFPDVQREAQRRIMLIMDRLRLNRLRRSYAALVAIAANTAKTWDSTAGKHPDNDVATEILTGKNATGVRATRVLYGPSAWQLRVVSFGAQNNAGGYANAGMTPEELARYLLVEGVMVSQAIYKDGSDAIAAAIGSKAIMFRSFAGATLNDSSVLKTFWTPCVDGSRYRVLPMRQVGDKVWRVAVECRDRQIVSGPATNTVRTLTIS